MNSFHLRSFVAAAALLVGVAAHAGASLTMEKLIDEQHGDVDIFHVFSAVSSDPVFPAPNQIVVTTGGDHFTRWIEFTGGWQLASGSDAGGDFAWKDTASTRIMFAVTGFAPYNGALPSISLEGDPMVSGGTAGNVSVTSKISNAEFPDGMLEMYIGQAAPDQPAIVRDWQETVGLPGQLFIDLSISESRQRGGTATAQLFHVRHTFAMAVPEPETPILLAGGMLVVAAAVSARKRRSGGRVRQALVSGATSAHSQLL